MSFDNNMLAELNRVFRRDCSDELLREFQIHEMLGRDGYIEMVADHLFDAGDNISERLLLRSAIVTTMLMIYDEDLYALSLLGQTLFAIWYSNHLGEECEPTNLYFVAKYHEAIDGIYQDDPFPFQTNGDVVMKICSSLYNSRIFPWRFLSLPSKSLHIRGFIPDENLIANPFYFDPYHQTNYFMQCVENMEECDILTEKEWMEEINFFFKAAIQDFEEEYSDYVNNYGFTDIAASNLSEYLRAHTAKAEIPKNFRKAINGNTF